MIVSHIIKATSCKVIPSRVLCQADEDLVHVVSETLQPEHVSMFCAPITTLDPSRNVATPRALLVV